VIDFWAGSYHALTWPQISFVAEDPKGRIVGYVLAKMSVFFSFPLSAFFLTSHYDYHHDYQSRYRDDDNEDNDDRHQQTNINGTNPAIRGHNKIYIFVLCF